MSVQRQGNWLGQQRVDVPHIRALESSICADFDVLGLILGNGTPQIIKGFSLVMTNAIGAPATSLQLVVAGGLVAHWGASESGSLFWAPSTRANETLNAANTNVTGSFTASSTNFIGLDLIRTSDSTTSDNVQFLDPNALVELPRTVPLGRTLNYRIIISVVPFSANSNVCPIAKVVTDANNNVTTVTDARNLLFRLGAGGDTPSSITQYTWPQGRNETTAAPDAFSGGDKSIAGLHDWNTAIMTRLWEIGGGEFWYSNTADKNVRMVGEGATLASGDYFSWNGTDLTWQNLSFIFNNSTGYYNEIVNQTVASAGLTNLAVGECIYVDLDRTVNRTRSGVTALAPTKVNLLNISSPSVPGARYIMAWRSVNGNVLVRDRPYPLGSALPVATTSALGFVELSGTPNVLATPLVPSLDSSNFAQASGVIRSASSPGGIGTVSITGTAASGGIGVILNNTTTLVNTAKIASFQNNGTEGLYIGVNGEVHAPTGATLTLQGSAPQPNGGLLPDIILAGSVAHTTGNIVNICKNGVNDQKAVINNNGEYIGPGQFAHDLIYGQFVTAITVATGGTFQTITTLASVGTPSANIITSWMTLASGIFTIAQAGTYRLIATGSVTHNNGAAQAVQFGISDGLGTNFNQGPFTFNVPTGATSNTNCSFMATVPLPAAGTFKIQITSTTNGVVITPNMSFILERVF